MVQLPYCGVAPIPAALLHRFNADPVLIVALAVLCAWQWVWAKRNAGEWRTAGRGLQGAMPQQRDHSPYLALAGWLIAAAAFLSPLCALSVSLFSARVAQHMILVLIAAPLIAMGLPRQRPSLSTWPLWGSTTVFFLALWIWHMPVPYGATFTSVLLYWSMHVTLFGSAIWLWRELLHHPRDRTVAALAAGTVTFVQMGLLGAVLAFADHPMFAWHFTTTVVWGLSALQDQQLGGIFMWVPGTALFLWTAVRSVARLWDSLEQTRPA